MDDFSFIVTVLAVSVTGVLAPGPLLAAAIAFGIRGGVRGGLLVALGHAVIEMPLIIALGIGIIPLELFPNSRIIISILGGIGLFAFAIIQVRSALRSSDKEYKSHIMERYGAFIVGIAVSVLNPFFLIWWTTIGLKLISDSQQLWPVLGPYLLFAIHIPLDIAWLCIIAVLAKHGTQLLHGIVRRIIDLGLAVTMTIIGIVFILNATV